MKILIYLHHPAHFYLFKNTIAQLKDNGHQLTIVATKKDVLEDLLKSEGITYKNFLPNGRKDSKLNIAWGLLKQDFHLLRHCIVNRPKVMIGTSTEICHVGFFLRIPNIFVNEDDVTVVPLVGKLAHPFAKYLLAPDVCNTGSPKNTIHYNGYHELAYLHPDNFKADERIPAKYGIDTGTPYFILRFAKLGAHHDKGISGITTEVAQKIVELLQNYGRVYITSERELEPEFEPFRLAIAPIDMHHIMAFADLYIGDSQTMAAEAGVLGIPFIRFNDFVGRIGYLNDLELNYKLGFGILPKNREELFERIVEIMENPQRKIEWTEKRQKMLSEKIAVDVFITNLLQNYPHSIPARL